MIITVANFLPLFPSLVEFVTPDLRHNQIHLHELFLLTGQVLVSGQLLGDSLTKFVPVQVTNQLFQVLSIELISLLECVDVDLNQIFILEGLRQLEFSQVSIFNLVHVMIEAVQQMNLLYLESCLISMIKSTIFLGHLIWSE